MCKQHPGLVKARASALVLSFLLSLVSCALHAATLSGVVKDQMGKPIDGAYARLFEVRNSLFYQSGDIIQVGADGAYQWDVSPGTYVLRAYFDGSDVALTGAPYRTVISSEDFDVNSDTVRDSLFDFVLLSGKVVDSNQSPIANVEIATATSWHGPEQGPALKRSQYSLNHSAGSVTTDADGNYAMLLFASNPCVASDYYADSTDCFYDLSFTPPNGSGFSSATQADIAINSARVLDQELTLLDSLNPKIIAGPYVKNITDQSVVLEWQTDEPVTASVQIINGATLTSDSLQSRHSVLINNLDPATEYSAQINTYDAQSNSTSSAIFTFSTASSHSDSLAPSFLQSPKATAISEHQFSVAFCADEPVSGKFLVENVDYAFAEPATCHALTVENLESNTSYAVAAEISDLAGNGPISSQTSMIKTLAAADLNPPLIIAGPSITDISDVSAIVKWTTNEPASSAVSFNDGSAYRAQSDPELVTEHALRITGLSAETSYQLSVASEDAAGNRSASGDARQFTTEAAPDTTAPVLIGRALVEDISASGATISWRSDESSSTVLYLGTNANSLNQLETAAGFSNLHRISVSNLQPNTRYYYVVESGDLAGNTVQSAVSSFTTLSAETSDTLEIISQAVIERLSGNSLTLSWRTNRYADSRLICESSNGSAEVNKTELSKQHLLTLIGLDFNTAYRCVVYSSDIEGRIASTVIGALTTDEVDSSAPQCVVPPEAQAAAGVAEISWQSNELATAVLNYRVKGTEQWSQNNHPSLSRSGFDLLTGLTAYTDYEYQLSLSDAVGNSANCALGEFNSGAPASSPQDPPPDDPPPDDPAPELPEPVFAIQPIVSDIGSHSATVSWSTERASSGQVRFGLAENALNRLASSTDFQTSHALVLNNLQADTTYFLQVDAFNASGTETQSQIISFRTEVIPPVTLTPPKIISGPRVKNISDVSAVIEWQTDKASNSVVQLNNGNTVTLETLSTFHSVFLSGLNPSTDYSSLVSSTDANGLTSATQSADFRTLATPDTSLPRFISGPTVFSIDFDRFTVAFCADEPVTAVLSVENASAPADTRDISLDTAAVCHQYTVSGLTPRTGYSLTVAISDSANNGPVSSTPILVTTLADLDITAPELIGPVVTDITQTTAIVRWTTNEAATSSLTYVGAGSRNTLEDSALVTEHSMYLSGLSASTTYTLTAWSTDAAGNGPSYSPSVNFTTLSLPDTSAPLIILGPLVENITTDSADIRWVTNESASRLVHLGLTADNLDQKFSLNGFDTNHRVPVFDLTADTDYFVQVESTDLSGNTTTSSIRTFRTLQPGAAPPPALAITAGPDVEQASTDSLTISWQTNLDADSRLVCEADYNGHSVSEADSSSSSMSSTETQSLAPFYSVAATQSIKDQYIVLLKEESSTESGDSADAETENHARFLNKRIRKNRAKRYVLSRKLSHAQRKEAVDALAREISGKVRGQALRKFSSTVPGFSLKMQASQLHTLRKDPRVLLIEQDQVMQLSTTQSNATWGLDRIDQINLPLSSDYSYTLDGSGVHAYIIDTGILNSHADFGGRAVSGWDYIDNDADASDCNGHGTHVAGTVGGNTWGVAKNVSLTGIRVLDCNGSGTSSGVIAGVDWVTANAQFPAVINMSLGGGNSAALDAAVNRAIDAGITVVVAAGNSNINACSGSPNRVPDAITVASSTSSDSRSGFSNWGSCVDMFAPGSDITSAWHNGGTKVSSGTSMAAPHVAGAAALYLEAHPNANPAEVTASLKGYASSGKISYLNGSPNLLLNVTFDGASELPAPPPPPPVEKITFEISDPARVKNHLLTLSGLQASTIYSCSVYSTDSIGDQVSASLKASTADIPDTEAPECSETPSATAYVDSAQISWASNELTTAVVNYRPLNSSDWLQSATLDPATRDALTLTGLLPETEYEQQVALSDIAGNTTQCPGGTFSTVAPEVIPEAEFTLQPVVSAITEHSATVSWSTAQPSIGTIRYGQVASNLVLQGADNRNIRAHELTLQNLESNTVYYLEVDAFNILGEKTTSSTVSFKTLHVDDDFDRDGIGNTLDNCPLTPNPDQSDSDADGIGDACDVPDVIDNDFDRDGVLNDVDNCPVNANPDQLDRDNDGLGDACDIPSTPNPDFDYDGILDDVDNCPTIPNADQADRDNNGIGDACDAPVVSDDDYDDDGVPDSSDNCPRHPNANQLDSDNDGLGDACDTPVIVENDYDNDGIADTIDNCPVIANPEQSDRDNNGIGDACDVPEVVEAPPATPVGISLSGTVSGEGVPVDGAEVALYTSQKQYLRSVSTNSSGDYLFEHVSAGDYFIGLTPPADSGLATPLLQSLQIADRDVVHLISLIGDALILSGYIKDAQGRVVDNILLSLHQQTNGNQVGNQVRTDELGYFEFAVAPGTYMLRPMVDLFNPALELVIPDYPVPDYAALLHGPQNIQLSANTTLDVTLPFALLSGQTLDSQGNPLAGVGLAIRHQYATDTQDYYLENYASDAASNAISDANGNFEFALFTDQAVDIRLTPPAGRPDLAVTTISDYSLSSDTSENFTLVDGVALSGTLQDSQGRPIDHAQLSVHDQDSGEQIGVAVFTDDSGLYSFQLEPGSYKIKAQLNPFGEGEGQRPSYPLPDYASILYAQEEVEVAGATVLNIELPMAILSGTVVDTSGSPVANTRVAISHIAYQSNGNVESGYYLESQGSSSVSHALTDANGEFSLALFTDQAMDINLMPPLNNKLVSATLINDYVLTQDASETFVLAQPYTLSGYLKDEQNTPIDYSMVTVHNQGNGQLADAPVLTDANGYFEFKVPPGLYQLRPYLQPSNQLGGTEVNSAYPVPDFAAVYYQAKNIKVFGNTSRDLSLPMSVLSGKALDANGVLVPGVKLRVDHAYARDSISYYLENQGDAANSNAITDSQGEFAFALFTGQKTDISVNPPLGSGFAITSVAHTITQESSEDIWLIHSDFAVPKIIAGPFVKHITNHSAVIEWLTDKPGSSVVAMPNNQIVQNTALSTRHSVVLRDLNPETTYAAEVYSVDKDERASETSATSFTTLAAPDFRDPLILEGPRASHITHQQFTLSLCADEPVTGSVSMTDSQNSQPRTFTLSELALCHQLEIESLNPDTVYTLVAVVTDGQGNGPVESQALIVTTLAAPDLSAPEIQLLPMVVDISATSAIVIWNTDEAASSGVSYNDGERYHVVTDERYVQEHSMALTDLSPETSYTLTVSSTDALGNGPTLSQAITFTTLASADTTAPVIIGSPLLQNITHQSAVIRWQTSEPATTRLAIGTSANELDRIESRQGLDTFHNLPVTGLQRDTLYYFQVHTSDAEGNLALSEVMSFRTKARGRQGNPHTISGLEVLQRSNSHLTLSWATDVNADARVVCESAAGTAEASSAKRSKQHTLSLSGLQSATSYTCTAYSTDHHGYTASLTLAPASTESSSDSTAPLALSAPITQGFGTIAIFRLETDEPAVARVEYRRQGSSLWQAAGAPGPRLKHWLVLQELTPSSTYELRYELADIEGNRSQSQVISFNSSSLSNSVLPNFSAQPSVSFITPESAVISWSHSESAFAQVSFGTSMDALLDKEANVDASTRHQVTLANIEPATAYYARVTAFNSLGESVNSEIVSFVSSAANSSDDSDGDGLTDSWEIEFGLNPQNALDAIEDPDNDGLSNLEEYLAQTDPFNADSDDDLLPDGWEVDHQLNPVDGFDAALDPDNNGLTHLNEYLSASDSVAPVISLNAEITVNARGPLTAVPTNNISASDNVDGSLAVVNQGDSHLPPGRHQVNWLAEDNAGNRTLASQTINILPQVLLGKQQSTAEGNQVEIKIRLSGTAPDYPVLVPYQIEGTADSSDYSLSNNSDVAEQSTSEAGVVIVEQGLEATLVLNIEDDLIAENDEELVLTLQDPVNAVMGNTTQHTVTITEANVAPLLTLSAEQDGLPVTTISRNGGLVTISVEVDDANSTDAHVFDWSASSNVLADSDSDPATLSFDPANIDPGVYTAQVRVSDDGIPSASSIARLNLRVLQSLPALSASQDSDGDGLSDQTEGYQDADFDGIADYLDPFDGSTWLHQQAGDSTDTDQRYLMQVEHGQQLTLGTLALQDADGGARVAADTWSGSVLFALYGNDSDYTQTGELLDFEVREVSPVGSSALLVIPLYQAIPANASYRKLMPLYGWQDFSVDANNQLYSAAGEAGVCPAPGDSSYQSGLTQGHYCLMMLIQDGGANDADGVANGTVVDPGGIASPSAESSTPSSETPAETGANKSSGGGSGGGGATTLFWLLWMSVLLAARQQNARQLSRKH